MSQQGDKRTENRNIDLAREEERDFGGRSEDGSEEGTEDRSSLRTILNDCCNRPQFVHVVYNVTDYSR